MIRKGYLVKSGLMLIIQSSFLLLQHLQSLEAVSFYADEIVNASIFVNLFHVFRSSAGQEQSSGRFHSCFNHRSQFRNDFRIGSIGGADNCNIVVAFFESFEAFFVLIAIFAVLETIVQMNVEFTNCRKEVEKSARALC